MTLPMVEGALGCLLFNDWQLVFAFLAGGTTDIFAVTWS